MLEFTQNFQLEVTQEILDEATPNECYTCAIALAVRRQLPSDIYPYQELGHGECNVDGPKVEFTVEHYTSESEFEDILIMFQLDMSEELVEWMERFDSGKYVQPIKIDCEIDSTDISNKYVMSSVYGRMNVG